MLDPVGSTSWHNRHLAAFRKLDELLREAGPADPTVLIVGPGAVTPLAALLLNDASTTKGHPVRKLVGDAARYGDQLLRRLPLLPLKSLEPAEVEAALSAPHRLVVVDRSQRVLDAVSRRIPRASCRCLDIGLSVLQIEADAVIAFNVVCRLENPQAGMANVAAAVKPGGWLLVDDRSANACREQLKAFEPAAPKIYRRREA